MSHILIGTAGHVDHGKTALIQALTGIDADRLKEEKKRGITIDLGYAYLELPDGGKASIIDVPGHEKFIKNMLAGAGGIDLVLLVIAADDGVMPQTREHLGILQLLDAQDGIVVLTKCDLVDEEWRDMVCEDIKNCISDTFLEKAPIAMVSSHTGQGIDELKRLIFEKIEKTTAKNTAAPFRLPVDRVFSVDGFGTVVTGTLIEGVLRVNDQAVAYPSGLSTRIRNLQVHGGDVDEAFAGQRVAVNISGVHREDMLRGDVLAPPDTLQNTQMLDVKLTMLKDSPREIKTGSRLHFYYGTRNALCKVMLLEVDSLAPGGEGYAQLRFSEAVAVKKGDHFVLRFYSPIETVGGGVVLDVTPKKHRRGKAAEIVKLLKTHEHGGITDHILQAIAGESGTLAPLANIQKRFGLDLEAFNRELDTLAADGKITRLGDKNAIDAGFRVTLSANVAKFLRGYHQENPLQSGIRKEELRSRILPGIKPHLFDCVLQVYADDNIVRVQDGRVALHDFEIAYSEAQRALRDDFELRLKNDGFTPPSIEELVLPWQKNKKVAQQVLEAMLAEGSIIATEAGIVFASSVIEEAKAAFLKLAEANDASVTLAQFRDAVQTSRKFALSLLEFFDRIGFTRKVGDVRTPAC